MNTLFLACCLLGADPASSSGLIFDSTAIDRGTIKAGVPLSHTFRLKNPTGQSITITSLKGGCGCLKPKLSSLSLLPGESATLDFQVNTLSQPEGPSVWKLALKYQIDPKQPEMEQELSIKANLVREVTIQPAALVVVTGEALQREFTVFDRRVKPLTIQRATLQIPEAKLECHQPKADGSGRRIQTVGLNIGDACPSGNHQQELILFTDDADYPEIRVPVQIIKRAANEVQASPDLVSLRFAKDQNSASGIVRLRDGSDRKIEIEKVECNHQLIQIKHVSGPGNMATVRITVQLGSERRSGESVVQIHLKNPDKQVIAIPVIWELP